MNGFTWLFTQIWNWSAEALVLAIYAAGSAALLAVVVTLVNVFCRRWLSARQMGLLWGLVLLRLLVPIAPASFFSLQNLLPIIENKMGQPSDLIAQPGVGYGDVQPNPVATTPYATVPAAADAAVPGDNLLSLIEELFEMMLPVVWLIGAIATVLGTAIVHLRFCRRLKQVLASDDARLGRLWNSCCQVARIRGEIPIVLTDSIDQPAVAGLFRPTLLLPEHVRDLEDEQLRMIMLHELAHVRRWHIAANWALVVVRALHWWNPVYWLAAARFQNLREQACDAFAIQQMDGCPTRGYGELLLALASRRPDRASWRIVLPVSILGFFSTFFRKRAVSNRLKALRTAGEKRSGWHTASIASLIALAAACGLTDAGTPQAPPERAWDWLPLNADGVWTDWDGLVEVETGKPVTRSYDVAKALRRIAADETTIDDARSQLKWRIVALLGGYEPDRNNPSVSNVKAGYEERVALEGVTLKVDAPLSMHAEIERNLRAWEQSGLAQICIETRFITDGRDIASALGISWQYLEARADDRDEVFSSESKDGVPVVRANAAVSDYLPITVANLNADQANRFAEAAQRGKTANLLQAPKITLINGERASVFDCTQTPFVVGLQNVGNGVQQPKIEVIDEGIKLNVCATQSHDATKVRLEARAELSEIIDGARMATMVLDGTPSTIQLPRVKRCRIDVCSEVPDGESLLVGCIPTYEQKRFFYVLLTVRNLREE